ncbi:NAD(P)H-quinone oxidoreductase subunit 4 [Chamaesiphon sp. VAR_48_metabat_403]|uniref:NAD(P)H-quinone oxidoreductase subunit 4 n=1 Tax=Chamaesiphon sp. VAR_48_metabat_403 TaxID=2964700 RepID=UPI00286E0298|nr:NAD(P)H-quinone oxidoreductase subunit 4 [Chamaesiphon sp. VAR_48_metabat_403]
MMSEFPWLTAIIAFPLIAALAIPVLPDANGKTVRLYTLGAGILELCLIIYTFTTQYDINNPSLQLVERYSWIPQLGLNWSLGVDGLSMPLVVLTGFVTTLATFAAWNISIKPRLFYSLMLVMYSAQIAVFLAQDLLMFFMLWELELVPVYLIISIWGGAQRFYAATKFILYTALASIFILIAALALAFYGDTVTFDMTALGIKEYPIGLELLAYAGLLIAFGVKLPIFPFHTWLPDAHGEAPAPGSMILAGVLLKMGGYALIRLNAEMLPHAHVYFAPVLAILGVVNIIYGALAAFSQDNLKRRLAYSSISHMGFVLIGISSFTSLGINGAMLQMISHGGIAAVLFFLAGVIYDRTHTLSMDKMGGIAKSMPSTFALFTFASMASLALPGMSGFASELTIFLGLTTSDVYSNGFKTLVVFLSAVGLLITPIYLLSMLRRVFFGKREADSEVCWDAKPRELAIAFSFLIPIIGIGLYPKLATQTYDRTTVAVAAHLREALPAAIAERQDLSLYARSFLPNPQDAIASPTIGGKVASIAR